MQDGNLIKPSAWMAFSILLVAILALTLGNVTAPARQPIIPPPIKGSKPEVWQMSDGKLALQWVTDTGSKFWIKQNEIVGGMIPSDTGHVILFVNSHRSVSTGISGEDWEAMIGQAGLVARRISPPEEDADE